MSWIAHNGAQEEFLQRTEFECLSVALQVPERLIA